MLAPRGVAVPLPRTSLKIHQTTPSGELIKLTKQYALVDYIITGFNDCLPVARPLQGLMNRKGLTLNDKVNRNEGLKCCFGKGALSTP